MQIHICSLERDRYRGDVFAQAVVASGPPGSAAVAAGSTAAAEVAASVLTAGGNAIDAVVAAGFATPMCEPVLSSIAGGGFCMYEAPGAAPVMLDFFVDVPGLGTRPEIPNVATISVNFGGNAEQVFHAGWGTVATPGCLPGLLDAHQRWGQLALPDVIAPAKQMAERGVRLDEVQLAFLDVVEEILTVTERSASLYTTAALSGTFTNPEYAKLVQRIADDGNGAAFLRELAEQAIEFGGIVSQADVDAYRPILRDPLTFAHAGATVWTNPAPSFGGTIIAGALQRIGDARNWDDVSRAMREATEAARKVTDVSRGTTHISVIDRDGGIASCTVSNGSGSGTVVDGVQLNNMLGEEDLNSAIRDGGIGAIHDLTPGVRMGSMMAPTLARLADGTQLAIGSGGSERIRSALITTLLRVIDHGMSLEAAVDAPRIHVNGEIIDVEPGLGHTFANEIVWPGPDLYFGGVHGIVRHPDGSVTAVADARRGGHVVVRELNELSTR